MAKWENYQFKNHKTGEVERLYGPLWKLTEDLVKENNGGELSDLLMDLHHRRNLNTNEISVELNRVIGYDVFNTEGKNQEIRRLLQRYSIKKREYNPREHERKIFAENGARNMRGNWSNPDFIERHAKASSERMTRMNERDWNDPELKSAKVELVRQGIDKYLENGGREEKREFTLKLWEDAEYRRSVITASPKNRGNLLEGKVSEILKSIGLSESEIVESGYLKFPCGNFCFPDFRVGNRIVEVDGDFWHAHPTQDFAKLTEVQKFNILRDRKKAKLYQENGYEVINLWESDINNQRESVKERLAEFLCRVDE